MKVPGLGNLRGLSQGKSGSANMVISSVSNYSQTRGNQCPLEVATRFSWVTRYDYFSRASDPPRKECHIPSPEVDPRSSLKEPRSRATATNGFRTMSTSGGSPPSNASDWAHGRADEPAVRKGQTVFWRPSQVGWRPSLLGWRPLLVGSKGR